MKGVNFYGPHSEYIISGSDCGNIFLWDRETEKIVQFFHGDEGGVVRFCCRRLCVRMRGECVRACDIDPGKNIGIFFVVAYCRTGKCVVMKFWESRFCLSSSDQRT